MLNKNTHRRPIPCTRSLPSVLVQFGATGQFIPTRKHTDIFYECPFIPVCVFVVWLQLYVTPPAYEREDIRPHSGKATATTETKSVGKARVTGIYYSTVLVSHLERVGSREGKSREKKTYRKKNTSKHTWEKAFLGTIYHHQHSQDSLNAGKHCVCMW